VENVYDYSCYFVKIRIVDEKIDSTALITVKIKKVTIVGAYDMNSDGLIDMLYQDEMGNVK
jgi:hypothetical protein